MKAYDLPLVDWILLGLNKERLGEVVSRISTNTSLDDMVDTRKSNRRYLEKILREEVEKQFSSEYEPLAQTVLNSIDSKPLDWVEDYDVHITIKKKLFSISDQGKGMSLDEVLRLLIIPFSTEKKKLETHGWRGVGFLSSLAYCKETRKNKVTVDTQKDGECYQVDFYSPDETIENLRMRVGKKRSRSKDGTKIHIKRFFDPSEKGVTPMIYLKHCLDGVPPYRARIFFNEGMLNTLKGSLYEVVFPLHVEGDKLMQKVGVLLNERRHSETNKPIYENKIVLTSSGVKVKSFDRAHYRGATIFFPPTIQVVEGWDDFKTDKAYDECSGKVFEALGLFIKESRKTPQFVDEMADLIPDIASALGMNDLKSIPDLGKLQALFLKGKKYAVTESQHKDFYPFLGETFRNASFIVSAQNCSYWQALYGNQEEIVQDFLQPTQTFTPKTFYKAIGKNYYPNLHLIAPYSPKELPEIRFVNVSPAGSSSLFMDKGALYVNTAHPHVKAPFNEASSYTLYSDFQHLPEIKAKEGLADQEAEHLIRARTRGLTINS